MSVVNLSKESTSANYIFPKTISIAIYKPALT